MTREVAREIGPTVWRQTRTLGHDGATAKVLTRDECCVGSYVTGERVARSRILNVDNNEKLAGGLSAYSEKDG
jgi:hypothetical protein